jgi:DNA repair ATPase RecN
VRREAKDTLSVDRDKLQALLSLAEQYVTEATTIIQRQEHLINELHHQPNELNAVEALVEAFRAAANAMARHQDSLTHHLRNIQAGS